ncbi:MAG: response regulator [Verrucomicrobia subdivision 3 bacterium]|nr:response regulator [Limisphaerales bacterium]
MTDRTPHPAPEPVPINGGNGKKVLVIDDTQDIRMIIKESLNLYGFITLAAEDGATGIEMAQKHNPDLIICDINMPNMDGYATLTALRDSEATTTTPFIFLSGATDKINMRRGMELGADDYLTKPFTHKELMAAVNARLEKQADLQRQSEKKLDELRGNITMALPHELRTPLNGILGLASLMIDDHASMPPEEVLESARFIHESALRLNRLIENFLLHSQIQLMASENKTIETANNSTPLAVEDVIPEVARKVAARFKRERDIVLEVSPGTFRIPAEHFRKIVEEIIDNALKFSEQGKQVRVSTTASENSFVLTVTDQGRGMTREQISNIGPHMQFERKTYEQQGSGLGLTIAKRLTELLGGQMAIESTPGSGTTIRISFGLPRR